MEGSSNFDGADGVKVAYSESLGTPGSFADGLDKSPGMWISKTLRATWVWALKEAAKKFTWTESPNTDKYKKRQGRAQALM